MDTPTPPGLVRLTKTLRERSPDLLLRDLVETLVKGEETWMADWRDLLRTLAPYYDCARRLGLETQEFFAEAAAAGPTSLAEIVREFGDREPFAPSEFGFLLVETPEGPTYQLYDPELSVDEFERLVRGRDDD